jgi:hypothetical protein
MSVTSVLIRLTVFVEHFVAFFLPRKDRNGVINMGAKLKSNNKYTGSAMTNYVNFEP